MNESYLLILVIVLLIVPRFLLTRMSGKTQAIVRIITGTIMLGIIWVLGLQKSLNIYLLIALTAAFLFSLYRDIRKNIVEKGKEKEKENDTEGDSPWTRSN